jgi:hypothetical protein
MDILRIESKLNIVSEPAHVAVYDFNFELFFACSHPVYFPEPETCILRIGAIINYAEKVEELLSRGLMVVNTPENHLRASELSEWYPIISEFTPQSLCQETFPSVEEVERSFDWPVFVKGSRQTSRHNPELSIAHNGHEYVELENRYRTDPILRWQKVAVREFMNLQTVPGNVPGKIKPSLEFRSFWWYGVCVGWGPYWYQVPVYDASDITKGLEIAEEAARRLNVPFLVVDIARTVDGRWIIIECNDAQESGYAGIVPQVLWRNILDQLT